MNESKFNRYFLGLEIILNKFPVDEAGKVFKILSTGISVINVIGMFPNINGQKWLIVAR